MQIIELSDITFASSIRVGKENYEKNFIDPLNRPEDRYYRLFYAPEQSLVYIISIDPALSDEKLSYKRKKACGMANVRCMTPMNIPSEIKTRITKELNKTNESKR